MEMRHTETGETAPVHFIGETESGQPVYQRQEGWDFVADSEWFADESGNYVVGSER